MQFPKKRSAVKKSKIDVNVEDLWLGSSFSVPRDFAEILKVAGSRSKKNHGGMANQ